MGGFLDQLSWRLVGPHRGGRVVAVAGHPSERSTFYFGSSGGGVWCTTDAGITWRNLSDGFFRRPAVGAIALAPSEPSVIYVGMGESTIRNNASSGDGVYRSVNGGLTWDHLGLEATRHIASVRVDPADSDLVYVAALGHAHGPNPERGIYRTRDGGASWEQILTGGEDAGAADLCLDPRNPRILYATLWQARRLPWRLDSGGPGSGVWRSTDGGDTWEDLSRRPGMPKGIMGRAGVTASGARPGRVCASSRPRTALSSAPTTTGTTGSACPSRRICAGGRGTTAASSPIRSMRRRCGRSTWSAGAHRMRARFSPPSRSSTATAMTCGSTLPTPGA